MKIVLQKFIADSGLCSRRKAEEMIKNGQVSVNGSMAELGMRVDISDTVDVDGKRLELAKENIYIILNKPKGYTCTNREFKNEKNIFELVKIKERLFAVGRLDKNSRGLLLLTNDGATAEKLTHPRYEHEKEYIVKCKYSIGDEHFNKENILELVKKVKLGIGDEEDILRVKSIKYLKEGEFNIVLTEGKKRHIRRIFKHFDLIIVDLVRVRMGRIKLRDLKTGSWRKLTNDEKESIK